MECSRCFATKYCWFCKGLCGRCYTAKRNGSKIRPESLRARNFIRDGEGILTDKNGLEWRVDIEDFDKCKKWLWSNRHDGYAENKILGYLHKFICPKFKVVDHKDRDTFNNHRSNLRDGWWINILNTKKRKVAASGYRGITKSRKYWEVRIAVKGKRIFLGLYDTIPEAVKALRAYTDKNGLSEFY